MKRVYTSASTLKEKTCRDKINKIKRYLLVFKRLALVLSFNCFERSFLCLPNLHLFDQKCSKNGNNVNYCYNLK